jgi:hypothetical protein
MSELRSATSRATLLDNLYAAAETLLQAVADPIILDEAPLNHRVQALDAIGRFIDRIEKQEAARRAIEPEPEPEDFDPDMPLLSITVAGTTLEMIDAYIALELEEPGVHDCLAGLYQRHKYLRERLPEALDRFDAQAARAWLKDPRPGAFTAIVWPDGEPHPSTLPDPAEHAKTFWPAPRVNPDRVRSQVAPYRWTPTPRV